MEINQLDREVIEAYNSKNEDNIVLANLIW